jgi:hypothetical protein
VKAPSGTFYDAAGSMTSWNWGATFQYDALGLLWHYTSGAEDWPCQRGIGGIGVSKASSGSRGGAPSERSEGPRGSESQGSWTSGPSPAREASAEERV